MLSDNEKAVLKHAAEIFLRHGCHMMMAMISEESDRLERRDWTRDKALAKQEAVNQYYREKRQKAAVCTTSPMTHDGPIRLAEEECHVSHELGENGAG